MERKEFKWCEEKGPGLEAVRKVKATLKWRGREGDGVSTSQSWCCAQWHFHFNPFVVGEGGERGRRGGAGGEGHSFSFPLASSRPSYPWPPFLNLAASWREKRLHRNKKRRKQRLPSELFYVDNDDIGHCLAAQLRAVVAQLEWRAHTLWSEKAPHPLGLDSRRVSELGERGKQWGAAAEGVALIFV